VLENGANSHRKILKEYSLEIYRQYAFHCHGLYRDGIFPLYFYEQHENYYMMLTIPYVLYGIFRYQYIIYQKKEGGSPEETVLSDLPL